MEIEEVYELISTKVDIDDMDLRLEQKVSQKQFEAYKIAVDKLQHQIQHMIVVFLKAYREKDQSRYKNEQNMMNISGVYKWVKNLKIESPDLAQVKSTENLSKGLSSLKSSVKLVSSKDNKSFSHYKKCGFSPPPSRSRFKSSLWKFS